VVASANSIVDPDDFARIASRVHFEPRYRQDRIEKTLRARKDHDAASFSALQSDVGSDYAGPLRDALLPMLERFRGVAAPPGPALALLEPWDGSFRADSAAPALYFFTLRELLPRCFHPLLGPEAGARYTGGRHGLPRLQRMLLDPGDPLRADVERAAGRLLGELASDAFRAAVRRVSRHCGPRPADWSWGAIQRVRLGTLLAEVPGLGGLFLALDAPFPGDDYTVSPSRSIDEKRRLRALIGASSRFVCDLGRPEEALFAHSAGPRGDPGSTLYANLSASWHRFEYFRSALWKPDEVPDPLERIVIDG
jgi:penicillin amidase